MWAKKPRKPRKRFMNRCTGNLPLKNRSNCLQQQLDEMHPENISDVRKFETKIAQSGMNEEARKEAEKVLNRMKQEGKDSHEYGMLYDYLDFVTSLSWKTEEQTEINLTGSRRDSG